MAALRIFGLEVTGQLGNPIQAAGQLLGMGQLAFRQGIGGQGDVVAKEMNAANFAVRLGNAASSGNDIPYQVGVDFSAGSDIAAGTMKAHSELAIEDPNRAVLNGKLKDIYDILSTGEVPERIKTSAQYAQNPVTPEQLLFKNIQESMVMQVGSLQDAKGIEGADPAITFGDEFSILLMMDTWGTDISSSDHTPISDEVKTQIDTIVSTLQSWQRDDKDNAQDLPVITTNAQGLPVGVNGEPMTPSELMEVYAQTIMPNDPELAEQVLFFSAVETSRTVMQNPTQGMAEKYQGPLGSNVRTFLEEVGKVDYLSVFGSPDGAEGAMSNLRAKADGLQDGYLTAYMQTKHDQQTARDSEDNSNKFTNIINGIFERILNLFTGQGFVTDNETGSDPSIDGQPTWSGQSADGESTAEGENPSIANNLDLDGATEGLKGVKEEYVGNNFGLPPTNSETIGLSSGQKLQETGYNGPTA